MGILIYVFFGENAHPPEMCALVYIEKIVSGRYFTKSPVGGGILAVAKSVRVRALFAGEHLDGSNASGQSS